MSTSRAWTTPEAIGTALRKRWDRGDLLRGWQQPADYFPLRLPLKRPDARELLDHFQQARDWARQWQHHAQQGHYSLEWEQRNHRQLGQNAIPCAVVFDTPEQALRFIRHRRQAERFSACLKALTEAFPELHDWALAHPLTVLEHHDDWPRLRAVLHWLQNNPRPGIYLRQLDLPGVDTKFIEGHRKLLSQLLDPILPETAIDTSATGARQFERRYGFSEKPATVRLRILDQRHTLSGLSDLQIPVDQFNALNLPVTRVFIVENDITALAFPRLANAIVIFGQGYGVDKLLGGADWLHNATIHYWGDIDTHGFAILNQLRQALPQAQSLLMDAATLEAHRSLIGTEPKPTRHTLVNLTEDEQRLYQALLNGDFGDRPRLEQERIPLSRLPDDIHNKE